MRTSRLLAQRIAMFEALLADAKTDADRRRLVLAIRQVCGEVRQRVRAVQPAEEFVPDYVRSYVRPRTRPQRKRGAA